MENERTLGVDQERDEKLDYLENEAACEEANRLKGRQLDDAVYAALLSRSHSDEARALVDTVTKVVTDHELAVGTRTNKRDKRNAQPVLMPHFPEGHEVPTFKQNQITIRSGYCILSNEPEFPAYIDDDPNNPLNF